MYLIKAGKYGQHNILYIAYTQKVLDYVFNLSYSSIMWYMLCYFDAPFRKVQHYINICLGIEVVIDFKLC